MQQRTNKGRREEEYCVYFVYCEYSQCSCALQGPASDAFYGSICVHQTTCYQSVQCGQDQRATTHTPKHATSSVPHTHTHTHRTLWEMEEVEVKKFRRCSVFNNDIFGLFPIYWIQPQPNWHVYVYFSPLHSFSPRLSKTPFFDGVYGSSLKWFSLPP